MGKLLRSYGHNTQINTEYDGSACDIMIALHARHSAEAINRYKAITQKVLIVVLGGTDVNTFLKLILHHFECDGKSRCIVCLHDQIGEALPQKLTKKLHTIIQSAEPLKQQRNPSSNNFDIVSSAICGMNTLRAAMAARLLNKSSKIRVFHLGKAHNDTWAIAAKEQMENPRYHWLGEVTAGRVRRNL